MFKQFALLSQAALLAFFVYLQYQGASIFGSDNEKQQPNGQHNASHK
ncbi:MAG: hypothetical protein WAO71_14865 [Gallionella sp.]